MKPEHLRTWRLSLPPGDDGKMPVSKAEAARRLNNTPPNTYIDWEAGRRRIPRMLPLACYAVSQGWEVNPDWFEDLDDEDA